MSLRGTSAILTLLLVVGCQEGETSKAEASATAAETATAAPPPTAKPKPLPKPKALNTAPLSKALRCAGKKGSGACGVINGFTECASFSPITPNGDGRWIGTAHVVKNGKSTAQMMMMRSKRVGTNDVAPGQLGAKIAFADLKQASPAVVKHAARMIRSLARGDTVRGPNAAITYIEEKNDWGLGNFVMAAEGNQTHIIKDGGGHLCRNPRNKQQILAIQLSGNAAHPEDGFYAEFYPAKW